jgi:hypothetical protein
VVGGGTRQEGGLGNRRRKPARCFNGCLRWTVAQRPSWRGAEAHEGGAGWSALGAKECGDEGTEGHNKGRAERRGTARVEWSGVAQRLWREEERRCLLRIDSATGGCTGRWMLASCVERTWRPVSSVSMRWWQQPCSCHAHVTPASGRH